jgi:hypothetical protein
MTDIPPEYKLTDEEMNKLPLGKITVWAGDRLEPICTKNRKIIADAAVAKAMPLIEQRAREEIAKEIFDFQLLALRGDLDDAHLNRDQYDNDPHWLPDKLAIYKEFWRGFSQHTANIIDAIEALKVKYLGQSLREKK